MKPQLHDKTLIKLTGLPAVPPDFFKRQARLAAEWNDANTRCHGDFAAVKSAHTQIFSIDLQRDDAKNFYVQITVNDLNADLSALPRNIQKMPVKIVDLSTRVPPRTPITPAP